MKTTYKVIVFSFEMGIITEHVFQTIWMAQEKVKLLAPEYNPASYQVSIQVVIGKQEEI